MNALLTDFYELTMAAGYFEAGKASDIATFELFIRRLPPGREYLIAAGLAQAVEYLQNLRFQAEEIAWLRSLPQFQRVRPEFWTFLRDLRFTGDLIAVPEGTTVYANEPIAAVRAPIIEAQLVETYLLSTIAFQTTIATKASLIVAAAKDRTVIEFGGRRAHGPEAGLYAGRAAYIGGCVGTSNTAAGFRFGIPVFGTAAHSWVLAFGDENEAFRRLQVLLDTYCVQLVDTYDTIEGTRRAAALGAPLWGIRLDSGDLGSLARESRRILDAAGMTGSKIMASSDLNENRIRQLLEEGAPIDAFGVGTALSTSEDAPALGAVYKLVELEAAGAVRFVAKHSSDKMTVGGAKQVFRYDGYDVVGWLGEKRPESLALLEPVLANGQLIRPLPAPAESRKRAGTQPRGPREVRLSDELKQLQQ